MNRERRPYPEIVSGENGWTVFEDKDNPRTSNLNKQMYVPMSGNCINCDINHNHMIRRHELGHVKWSPKTIGRLKEGEHEKAIHVLEEVRIHHLLNYEGLLIDKPVQCIEKTIAFWTSVIFEGSIPDIVLALLSVYWTSSLIEPNTWRRGEPDNAELSVFKDMYNMVTEAKILTLQREKDIDWAIELSSYFYDKITKKGRNARYWAEKISYRKVRIVAKELSKLLDEFPEKPLSKDVLESEKLKSEEQKEKQKKYDEQKSSSKSDDDSDELAEDTDRDNRKISLQNALQETEKELYQKTKGEMEYTPSQDFKGRWYDYDVITPDLPVNLQSKLKEGREYRPMDYGYNPKYINRYCIDKKIFKQRQKVYGGTILIDASGSMQFSGDDILEIMQELPAVKIAMYNIKGYQSDKGSIRIIGNNGKRATEEYMGEHSGGGNGIDGPALRWLSQQKPKRIWVSDMYVFGKYNSNSNNLLQECKQIMNQNGIFRLADIDEVKRFALEINKL